MNGKQVLFKAFNMSPFVTCRLQLDKFFTKLRNNKVSPSFIIVEEYELLRVKLIMKRKRKPKIMEEKRKVGFVNVLARNLGLGKYFLFKLIPISRSISSEKILGSRRPDIKSAKSQFGKECEIRFFILSHTNIQIFKVVSCISMHSRVYT
jgi:hypothetical protein